MMLQADNLAPLAGLRHGFFTRQGGVSRGPFASLNCGFSGGDDPALVSENRGRALRRLGLSPDSLCTARQVHGTDVLVVREPCPGKPASAADALVTDRAGLALGVLSADCAPVLLADPTARVAGAAHAGWRGARAGVVEAALDAMVELGAGRERIVAAIGPCIGRASYEVGPDVREEVLAADPDGVALFEAVPGSDRLLFDLKGCVRSRLARAGITTTLEALPHDTAADEARFFSHRRTRRQGGERFGLLLSVIAFVD